MLNQTLIQEIQRINAQDETGSLVIDYGDETVRFFFRDGDLQLLDYGQEKELLLARQYRLYHKIGPEIEALVTQMVQTQGVKVHEYLRQQQLVTDEESAQVTRTLVEDKLCDWFDKPSQSIEFRGDETEDDYDLGTSAVKLRIQVDLLLQMVQARLGERAVVREEIPDWNMVFGLEEGAPGPEHLNDNERHVMHFIDGRKTVADIASAVRDSSLNTACYLISMQRQGYIRPTRNSTRLRMEAVSPEAVQAAQAEAAAPTTTAQPAVMPTPSLPERGAAPASPIDSFTPVYRRETPRSKAPVIVLAVVLIVVGGLWWLVSQTRSMLGEVQNKVDKLNNAVTARDWQSADALAGDLLTMVEGDSVQQGKIRSRINEINQTFVDKADELMRLVNEGEIAEAERQLAELPDPGGDHEHLLSGEAIDEIGESRAALGRAQERLRRQGQELARNVEKDLKMERVSQALRRLAGQPELVTAQARDALRIWRQRKLDNAGDVSMSLKDREEILAQVAMADPSTADLKVIERTRKQIALATEKLGADVAAAGALLDAGDYRGVEETLAGAVGIARGTEYQPKIEVLLQQAEELGERMAGIIDRGRTHLKRGKDLDQVRATIATIDQVLTDLPEVSDRTALVSLKTGLDYLERCIGADTIADEMALLAEAQENADMVTAVKGFLQERLDGLRKTEQRLEDELQDIINYKNREGVEFGKPRLEEFLARREVRRSSLLEKVQRLDKQWTDEREERNQRFEELKDAILAREADRVESLGNQLRLPRLPLGIFSEPAGAEVFIGKELMGETPLVNPDISPDRVNEVYTIKLKGYEPVEVLATEAVAGWKIERELDRSSIGEAQVRGPITSEPAFIDGLIWIAGSSTVAAVKPDGNVVKEMHLDKADYGGAGLSEPVYAPIVEYDDMRIVTTRDAVGLRITDGKLSRFPLAGRSNHAALRYVSPHVLDRELFVVADLDGRLIASDSSRPGAVWQSSEGAPHIASPLLMDAFVLSARADGGLEVHQVDNGISVNNIEMDENLLAAWPAPERGLAGIGVRSSWVWDGGEEVERTPLPNAAIEADRGVIMTTDYRVHIQLADGSWKAVGKVPRNEFRITALRRWGDQAVVVHGQRLLVLGPRSFVVRTDKDFCPPIVAGEDLVVVSTDGLVRIYAP